MNKVNSIISKLLDQYLIDCSLSKIAFFANYKPTKSESKSLAAYFSYICFCASSLSEKSSFLFNKYWAKFKKVPFDVFISPIDKCVTARQYNFISLRCTDLQDTIRVVSFVKMNKLLINERYPILLRLIVETRDVCSFIEKNDMNVECKLSPSDVIMRIDK